MGNKNGRPVTPQLKGDKTMVSTTILVETKERIAKVTKNQSRFLRDAALEKLKREEKKKGPVEEPEGQ